MFFSSFGVGKTKFYHCWPSHGENPSHTHAVYIIATAVAGETRLTGSANMFHELFVRVGYNRKCGWKSARQRKGSFIHFTLHLLSDWRVGDSSPLAYLRERTCELDIAAFLHCKDSKICFVGLAYGIAKAGE